MQAPEDRLFAGSIPELYERHLVPMIFEPYARDIAARLARYSPQRILEVAAGTGVVTRALTQALPAASIVATDLNQPMLDLAKTRLPHANVEWRQADALQLPFPDASFDAVVCQFGVMFFPDKRRAFAEARRVLRNGGVFLFSVWDRLEDNEFAAVVADALAGVFPHDPPRFMTRVPHGYHDTAAIARDLAAAGFDTPARFETLTELSRASSPEIPAIAFCQGTPVRNEIEARDATRLAESTAAATEALRRRFGTSALEGKIQAHIVAIDR